MKGILKSIASRLARVVRDEAEPMAIGQSIASVSIGPGGMGVVPRSIGGAMMVGAGRRIGSESNEGALTGPDSSGQPGESEEPAKVDGEADRDP